VIAAISRPRRHHPVLLRSSASTLAVTVQGDHRLLRDGYDPHARRRFVWDPVTAYSVFGTALTVCVLPIYFVTALACPVYYLRYRRSELNVFVHVIVPVLGAILLVPAFLAGAGIPIVSFATPLSWPLSLTGPIVGVWYVIGMGIAIYLYARRRASLRTLSESTVDIEPTPHGAMATAKVPLTANGAAVPDGVVAT
jgi:hypothetical protein